VIGHDISLNVIELEQYVIYSWWKSWDQNVANKYFFYALWKYW